MSWLNMFMPKRVKQMVEILREWEVGDVAEAVELVSLMTAHVDGIDNYRTSIRYGIAMLKEYPEGKVSPGHLSKWGGSKYLGILRGPRQP